MSDLSYLQASVTGLLQGITELFPVSSLGHSVLVPALLGGSWQHLVSESSSGTSGQSPYLAFIVALHVATAFALIIFFRRDWIRLGRALITTVRTRRVETSEQRMVWLLIVATIPVGLTGLLLEHSLRTLFAKPLAAALFLTVNGAILLAGERLRRQAMVRQQVAYASTGHRRLGVALAEAGAGTTVVAREHRPLATLAYREAGIIGFFQTFALLAGISRSGISMAAGLLRGLDHEDAARFSFLLATPVILAAGVLKLPTLAGSAGAHIHGQVIVGMLIAGAAAYASVKYLVRYFETRTLTPFAIYCLIAGVFCTIRFAF